MTVSQREEQIAQAEELLGDRIQDIGFAKGLFFGQYLADKLLPYPDPAADSQALSLAADLAGFCADQVDPVAIDREARIPDSVVEGLGRLGILGACLPKACGVL